MTEVRWLAPIALALLTLLVPLIFLYKVYNPSPGEVSLYSSSILIALGGSDVADERLLLLNVNDTVLISLTHRKCGVKSYNFTIIHLSSGDRYSTKAREAQAPCCPLFIAPREGVYLFRVAFQLEGGDKCEIAVNWHLARGDRGGYAKLYTLESMVGALVLAVGATYAIKEYRKTA